MAMSTARRCAAIGSLHAGRATASRPSLCRRRRASGSSVWPAQNKPSQHLGMSTLWVTRNSVRTSAHYACAGHHGRDRKPALVVVAMVACHEQSPTFSVGSRRMVEEDILACFGWTQHRCFGCVCPARRERSPKEARVEGKPKGSGQAIRRGSPERSQYASFTLLVAAFPAPLQRLAAVHPRRHPQRSAAACPRRRLRPEPCSASS